MNNPACKECPSPESCLATIMPTKFGHFCDWAKSGDALKRKAIVGRAAIGIRPEPPGLLMKAKNFARAATRHIAAGSPMASEEQKNARLTICQACEYSVNGGCRLCGCNMDMKAGWADSCCPLAPPKWGPVPPDQRV